MTMQHAETYPNTQLGATRQTRRRPTLLPVLKEMMDSVDNPHTKEERQNIKAQFIQFMHSRNGAQFHETAYLYWFDNHYRRLLLDYVDPDGHIMTRAERTEKGRVETVKKTDELRQRATAVIEEKAEEKAQIMLLSWVLPNGKPLRDCTGRECRQMSGKVGGWLRKISDRIKPTDLVGKVMQEADVRKLYGKDV